MNFRETLRAVILSWDEVQQIQEYLESDIPKYQVPVNAIIANFKPLFGDAEPGVESFGAMQADDELRALATEKGLNIEDIKKWLDAHPLIAMILPYLPYIFLAKN